MPELKQIFAILAEFELLTAEHREIVINHKNRKRLLNLLLTLKRCALLTPENFFKISHHSEPRCLDMLLAELDKLKLLTPENFVLVCAHPMPIQLLESIRFLHHHQRMNAITFTFYLSHPEPSIVYAIESLPIAALTPPNLQLIGAHHNPASLGRAFQQLIDMQLFTDEYRDLISTCSEPHELALVFSYLHRAHIATSANLQQLIAIEQNQLITGWALHHLWSIIPSWQLTPTNLNRLIAAAQAAAPREAIMRVRDQIRGNEPVFNPAQSTHTTSVHQTVSASAAKLMHRYRTELVLETKIQEIIADIKGLDDEPKHQAAKRCIERITQVDYTFVDSSGISIRQLLALAYIALHDESKRLSTLADAKALFIEGLYEIQRGYNLNALGQDQDGEDLPICTAGTFNKILEKLNGIHPDVEIYYITHEGASSKFPRVAKAHAIAYLQALSTPTTAMEYQRIKRLVEGLKTDTSLELIWENIKAGVQAELWEEFSQAYVDNKHDARFLALINNGQYLPVPDLTAIEAKLEASLGHQAFLDAQVCLNVREQRWLFAMERNCFWSQRHSSPRAQQQFDEQYGLVLKGTFNS